VRRANKRSVLITDVHISGANCDIKNGKIKTIELM